MDLKTHDGVPIEDGMVVWFVDRRQTISDGWKEISMHDGAVVVNGIMKKGDWAWRIDKKTEHNESVCEAKGQEIYKRYLPNIYHGDGIDRLWLFSNRQLAEQDLVDRKHFK